MNISIYKKNKGLNIKEGCRSSLVTQASGFTLVELMVAISIFMMIMTTAMGSLLVTLDAKKKAEALNFTMDNLNFAMESMTRTLRMGKDYVCVGETNNCSGVKFTPSEQIAGSTNDVTYSIVSRGGSYGTNTLRRCSPTCVDIIADNINIDSSTSKFYVKGVGLESAGSKIQPSIYIKISGSVTVKNDTIPFAIQTMVSQRTLDF